MKAISGGHKNPIKAFLGVFELAGAPVYDLPMQAKKSQDFTTGKCDGCGLPANAGRLVCETMRDELLAREFEQPAYWRYHRMAVDAFCLQHPRRYCESAKSLAAHLCGLCIAFEMNNDAAILRGIQQWLSGNPDFTKPDLPASRGDKTVADVHGLDEPSAYGRAVEGWARSVWAAYSGLHATARDWVSQSRRPRPFKTT